MPKTSRNSTLFYKNNAHPSFEVKSTRRLNVAYIEADFNL